MGWKNQSKERCERKLNGKWLQDDISIHQLAGIGSLSTSKKIRKK